MSNTNSNHSIRSARGSRILKRRVKSVMVRDANGSTSAFRQFYQSGGRDYEQYRRWLQTLSKSNSLSTDLSKVKDEPLDMRTNAVSLFPSLILSPSLHIQQQQQQSLPKIVYTHNSQRHLSIPINTQLALPIRPLSPPLLTAAATTTTTSQSKIQTPCDYSHIPVVPSTSLNNWSVADVGRFIEQHFPNNNNNIARKFIQQKIDGRTLPLLTEDHLIKIFKMKLGPALHLLALISTIQIQN
ncbi:unnamed protein product [Adineta steineri]|uniref:SAM domain-containing protein n=1 Tax=Adineta steineri TaxID=433720 RepID=A0A818UW04_9BILA|nr:unnamed protein product [Adineta steineri]CAF1087533.1 unnamed protein product [Adineta steineri]CAF3669602.1 unnamed protein product [Adineta steineri]CAF3703976.1 unnamed protein product [Adineta steineri]